MERSSFYVLRVAHCPMCDGSGKLNLTEHEKYWEEFDEHFLDGPVSLVNPKNLKEEEFDGDFPTVRHINEFNERFAEAHGLRFIADNDAACPECDGSGVAECRVPLEHALLELGILKGEGA